MKQSTLQELSLRPYPGRLFLVATKKEYEQAHKKLFKTADSLTCATSGRLAISEGGDGVWTYLVFANSPNVLAHEFSHVLFYVFGRCRMDPRDSAGEAFCYMLSQLLMDAELKEKNQ